MNKCIHAQIDLQATTGYKDIIFGGEATFDSAKQDVTKWSAGVGMSHQLPCVAINCQDLWP